MTTIDPNKKYEVEINVVDPETEKGFSLFLSSVEFLDFYRKQNFKEESLVQSQEFNFVQTLNSIFNAPPEKESDTFSLLVESHGQWHIDRIKPQEDAPEPSQE